jgi:hypothetical protein
MDYKVSCHQSGLKLVLTITVFGKQKTGHIPTLEHLQ